MQKLHFQKSSIIKGITWLGDRIPYPEKKIKGDTYPMTWADDDRIYASSGDPHWGETESGLDLEAFDGGPTDYKITKVNHMNDFLGHGGHGPKPSGMICVDKNLYLAFQNFNGMVLPPYSCASQPGSDSVIIVCNHISSSWKGANWTPDYKNIEKPTFPGYKFGGPAFINYGKNNENAREQQYTARFYPVGGTLGSGDSCRADRYCVERGPIYCTSRTTTNAANGTTTHRSNLDANSNRRLSVGNSRYGTVKQNGGK